MPLPPRSTPPHPPRPPRTDDLFEALVSEHAGVGLIHNRAVPEHPLHAHAVKAHAHTESHKQYVPPPTHTESHMQTYKICVLGQSHMNQGVQNRWMAQPGGSTCYSLPHTPEGELSGGIDPLPPRAPACLPAPLPSGRAPCQVIMRYCTCW